MKLPSLLLVLVMKVVVDKLRREGIEKLFVQVAVAREQLT